MSHRSSACCASAGGRPAALSSSPIAPLSAPPPPCGPSLRTAARDGQDLQDTPLTCWGGPGRRLLVAGGLHHRRDRRVAAGKLQRVYGKLGERVPVLLPRLLQSLPADDLAPPDQRPQQLPAGRGRTRRYHA